MSDDLLDRATRALARETASAVHDDQTLPRILDTLEGSRAAPTHQRSWLSWAAAAALMLAGLAGSPTAWAWSVGMVESLLSGPALAPEPAPEPEAPDVAVEAAPMPLAPPPPAPASEPEPSGMAPPEAMPARARRRSEPDRAAREPQPQEAPVDPAIRAERELFETAHRLHFGGGGREQTLGAWDAYLGVHPAGRYAPEARYNRALTLVRLGRSATARAALEDLSLRGYRASDARALLDAMGSP